MKTVELKNWQEFRDFIDSNKEVMPVYWRGQNSPDWPLASTFERKILNMFGGQRHGASKRYPYDNRYVTADRGVYWSDTFIRGMRDGYLQLFRRAATTLRGDNPSELDEDQWWALGRHYGLITPLLDWTEKPYIAAFFALIDRLNEMYERSAQRGVSSLSIGIEPVAIYRLFHNRQLEGEGLSVLRPQADELGRLYRQWGVFTRLESERYFELEGFLNDTGRGDHLTQILLSEQAVLSGLRDLDAHGINYSSLFPDLEGAAKFANLSPELPI